MEEAGKRGTSQAPSQAEIDDESRRARRLQIVVSLALNIIAEGELPFDEASHLMAATRRVALTLFPDKESVYDLIYRPKFQRLINEVYRVN